MAGGYRDVSAERRMRAAACVERHLDELGAVLRGAGLEPRIVEGSAVAAEVYLAETATLHTSIRVGLFTGGDERSALERALRRGGFDRAEPAGDQMLLRMASRAGRRAVYVLIDGADGADDDRRHPGDPAAARARAARFIRAWRDVAVAYRRVRHERGAAHDVTESFEVHLVEG